MSILLIAIAAFVAVAALVGGLALILRDKRGSKIEDRLDLITGRGTPAAARVNMKQSSVLARPLDAVPGFFETFFTRFASINLLFEQADTSLTIARLVAISAVMALIGAGLGATLRLHAALMPLLGVVLAAVPIVWLMLRRR